MEHRQEESVLDEKELLRCCGSTKFAKEMALASPFSSFDQSFSTARHIWFNLVDVNCWVEAFTGHPQIGLSAAPQWSKAEQSTALATSTESSLQELTDWNARYRLKFGIVSLICASGRTTAEILTELKKRYSNRPIIELEIAAQEQMKITELRMAKLFSAKAKDSSSTSQYSAAAKKAEGGCWC